MKRGRHARMLFWPTTQFLYLNYPCLFNLKFLTLLPDPTTRHIHHPWQRRPPHPIDVPSPIHGRKASSPWRACSTLDATSSTRGTFLYPGQRALLTLAQPPSPRCPPPHQRHSSSMEHEADLALWWCLLSPPHRACSPEFGSPPPRAARLSPNLPYLQRVFLPHLSAGARASNNGTSRSCPARITPFSRR